MLSPLGRAQTGGYTQNNLISDGSVPAKITDKTLINPWGIAIGQQTPFWINDAGSGISAVYDAAENKQFVVRIPSGGTATATGQPAGIVFNSSSSDFMIEGGSAFFLFGTLNGTISAWNPTLTDAKRMIDNSAAGAVYSGVTIAQNSSGSFLLAANLAKSTIDVFDMTFAPATLAGKFVDPSMPAGFAPFNVRALNGNVYVLYAMQTPGGGPPRAAPSAGFVDVFDTSGNFVKRAISGGSLNAPWGIAVAPSGFGAFGGDLLVGNFGDGTINAFDPTSFASAGQLTDSNGKPIHNDRLWEIIFGQNGTGDPNTLYFSAGVNNEKGGLFGAITSATPVGTADFSVAVSAPNVTLATGGSAATQLSVTPLNGFSGPVSFAASDLPAGLSAQFSPASVTPAAGQAAMTTLTVAPTPSTAAPGGLYGATSGGLPQAPGSLNARVLAATAIPFGIAGLLALLRKRRRGFRGILTMGVLASLCVGGWGILGCGSASKAASSPTQPPVPGTSTVTVTATSGALSHTTTFSLVVQ